MVTFISFSDLRGGAAKAAYRIWKGLKEARIDIKYVVAEKKSTSDEINGPSFFYESLHFSLRAISFLILKLMKTNNKSKHSLNLFSSPFVLSEAYKANVLHLNWVNNETISISSLAKLCLRKKVIITLHDEWIYCGAEHCSPFDGKGRYVEGYSKRNSDVLGIDLNLHIWNLKRAKYLNLNNVIFTVPSKWLLDRALSSYLLSNKRVELIPNPIPTEIFKPKDISDKKYFGADECNDFVIVFGAVNIENNPLKGGAVLVDALELMSRRLTNQERRLVKLVIFGGETFDKDIAGFEANGLGNISSEIEMANIYDAGAITVVPSFVESFGQVAAESLACGTPVLAFNSSGIKDIVHHKKSGFLAEPFKSESLAEGLLWLFHRKKEQLEELGEFGRIHVEQNFSTHVVIEKFKALYEELAGNHD